MSPRFGDALASETTGAKPLAPVATEKAVRVVYRTTAGEELSGVFVLTLPSLDDKVRIARVKVHYSGGHPMSLFTADEQHLFECMARVEVLLAAKGKRFCPEWFVERGQDQLDADLIYQLGNALISFENSFFRASPGTGGTEKAGPGVVILPADGDGDGA